MSCRKDLGSYLSTSQSRDLRGRKLWRSLDELSESAEFRELLEREFPRNASIWPDSLSRRQFLTLMGASFALGGLGGCSVRPAPSQDIVPYVRRPEEGIAGKPLFYATTMTLGGDAVGLLAESYMGRPIKIEGNPDHPASLGATSPLHQASILGLYDPDRAQTVTYQGHPRTWSDAENAIGRALDLERSKQGAGLRILTDTVVSPTLANQLSRLLDQFPQARWCMHEPLNHLQAERGAELAFGQVVIPRYDFTRADVVLSLDADFLASGRGHLRHAADFMSRRRTPAVEGAASDMNRLFVVETAVTCTGAKADHRLATQGRNVVTIAHAIAATLNVIPAGLVATDERFVRMVSQDLLSHAGRSLVVAGDRQPANVHLLVHAINERLGNVGSTVTYGSSNQRQSPTAPLALAELTQEMARGEVTCLFILGTNPAFTAEADVPFVANLERVPLRVRHGLHHDETSRLCHWNLPDTHYLEAWSDAQTCDGTCSLVQPLIEPLYEGRSYHELLALLLGEHDRPGRDIVRDYWRSRWRDLDSNAEFERRWELALHDGVIADTVEAAKSVTLVPEWQQHLQIDGSGGASEANDWELAFITDPTLHDGRFANNGWLQELPKPITQLTWGNAAIMSPAAARELGVEPGSYAHGGEHGGYHMPVVQLEIGGTVARLPCWIMPGYADKTVGVYLGGGRTAAGRIGGSDTAPVGTNVYLLRTTKQPWFASGLQVSLTDERQLVACTQAHHAMEGRRPVVAATLASFRQTPDFIAADRERDRQEKMLDLHEPLTFYEPFDYGPPKHRWGMSIDLTTCIGCNACVVACQAENNIPVVGKDQVAAGREMHWLRVDRYIDGEADQPDSFHFQPVPCMHCENAPCEYVCPVEATVHSADGLNDMIYNRCVGTRFCSNNCPYKVRRFNFLAYADFQTETLRLQYNPEVTVRSRGVMEKCTYCVQRLRRAEIDSEVEQRQIVDGEVLTACQAACPTRAIVFGDINDTTSDVRKRKASPLNYSLLEELNTEPRTTYLAELRNPLPHSEEG